MKVIAKLAAFTLILSGLTACPPIDDDDGMMGANIDGGMTGMEGADSGLPDDFGDECVCEDESFVCEEPCSETLICAAFTCTLRCTEDSDCTDGFTCSALSDMNFDTDETTNLGTKYCLGM